MEGDSHHGTDPTVHSHSAGDKDMKSNGTRPTRVVQGARGNGWMCTGRRRGPKRCEWKEYIAGRSPMPGEGWIGKEGSETRTRGRGGSKGRFAGDETLHALKVRRLHLSILHPSLSTFHRTPLGQAHA